MGWTCYKEEGTVMRKLEDYKRIISIGDIHGHYDKAVELWEKIRFNDGEDLLIFHGDYIDRGAESVRTLQFVKSLVESHENIIALKGNHENYHLQLKLAEIFLMRLRIGFPIGT